MRRLSSLALALTLLLVSSLAIATTVVRMDLKELVSASDAIVVGSIADVESKLHDDGKVYTHVRVTVDETLKGEKADELTIVHIGGRVESRATIVHGMPDFRADERVLLFLEKPDTVDHFVVTGLSQGKFTLKEGENDVVNLIPAGGDMALVKPVRLPTGDVKLERAEPAQITRQAPTLDDMRRRITELQTTSEDTEKSE